MIVDRGGVLLSPLHGIDGADALIFIRVIFALTRVLNHGDLGQDPSVIPLLSHEDLLRIPAPPFLIEDFAEKHDYFMSYIMRPFLGDDQQRWWCTIGPPIWVSLSLLGRSTVIWRVLELREEQLVPPYRIMKSSWRSTRQPLEFELHAAIGESHLGLANPLVGGDAIFPSPPGEVERITISSIRGDHSKDFDDRTLHRIVFEINAKPLWMYENELQLLFALRTIIESLFILLSCILIKPYAVTLAHKFLWDRGILHCDINPGSVLLSEAPATPAIILIPDMAMARVSEGQIAADEVNHEIDAHITVREATIIHCCCVAE